MMRRQFTMIRPKFSPALIVSSLLALAAMSAATDAVSAPPSPASDPENQGGWVLNKDLSDEFDGEKLDEAKWFVEGQNGDYYIWKGRAPSQFAPHNVRVENGRLKLRSQWEPDFVYAVDEGHEGNTYSVHEGQKVPVTTAGVITKKRFLYGYMEAKTKACDATMTSSFWCIGYESELDVYEQMGQPKIKGNIRENWLKTTVHDWAPPGARPTQVFGNTQKLPFRVADDFHIYGAEWAEDYLKLYVDGKLIHTVTKEEVGDDWVLNNPLEIWFDSEIFVWLGLPDEGQLPVDYEVEYLRVWQKPHPNLLDRAFHGFEGPFLYQENEKPLNLIPESSRDNDYQKFWKIDLESARYLSIVRDEHSASGQKSLRFLHEDDVTDVTATAVAPPGSVRLPAGDFTLSMKVWKKLHSNVKSVRVRLEDGGAEFKPFNLTDIAAGEWVALKQSFTKDAASSPDDRLIIEINDGVATQTTSLLYVDDIAVEKK